MTQRRSAAAAALVAFFLHSLCLGGLAHAEEDVVSAGNTVSMQFDGTPLKDVLKLLSQQSGLNFAASEEAENKKVTVFLQNVPVRDAIEAIISANNLTYEQKKGSNVIIVHPAAAADAAGGTPMQTRIFPLKFTRLSISPQDVGGQSVIKELLTNLELTNAGGAAAKQEEAKPADEEAGSASKEKLVAERGVDKLVASLLSENGRVAVDIHTNSLIVTDTPDKLALVEKVLSRIDVPQQQAMIDVHLLEVRKDVLDDHGIEWGGDNGALFTYTGGSKGVVFPFRNGPDTSITLGTLSATNFAATLHFLTTQTDTKILARPRVLTLNNEAAVIKLVTQTAVAESSTLTASEGISTLTTGEAQRSDVGIILKLTPQINIDDSVGLFVEPSVTTVAASTFFPSSFLDPTTRSVRTMARVKNHETLVIGGLIDSNRSQSRRKIPFFGDLPVVGKAFHYDNRDNTDRELLVFITPHIVRGDVGTDGQTLTTYGGRDLAVRRVLDQFKEEYQTAALDPIESIDRASRSAALEELRRQRATANLAKSPALDTEMTRALDSASPEKIGTVNYEPKNIKK